MSEPMHLHCKSCVAQTKATGEKHLAVFRALFLDGDLYLICPIHDDEPVGIFALKNPIHPTCDGCGNPEHKHA